MTWNSASDIGWAVASVRSPSSQVIVVDNASGDGSADGARAAGAEVIVEAGDNLGFARGCNLGVRHATAPLVLFLNPDAALEPGGVEAIQAFFDSHPGASILGPAIADEAGRRARTAGFRWSLLTELGNKTLLHRLARPPSGTRHVRWVSGAAMAARTDAVRRLGGFDPEFFLYYEDLDLCARALDAGMEVWFSDAVKVTHAGKRSSQRVEERALLVSEASTQRYWRLHGGRLRAGVVRALTVPEMGLRSALWSVLSVDPKRRSQAKARRGAYRRIAADALGLAGRSSLERHEAPSPPSAERPGRFETGGQPLVSVVIATYNRAAMVHRAIDSVLKQDYAPLEVIVVDDGSTDETPAVLEAFTGRIKAIRQENQERGAARNAGLRASSGELVAFLDSDDEWQEGHLAPMVEALIRRPDIGMVYRQAEFYDDEAGAMFDVLPRHPIEGDLFLANAAGNRMVVDAVLVRRALLDEVGWFDEDRQLSGMEDWELWTRCLGASAVAFVPGLTVRVHFHARNTVGNRVAMERAIRSASEKILQHPRNRDRLAPHRRRLRAGMWALLAHLQMLAGDGPAAWERLREGLREDPRFVLYPVFNTMVVKACLGPGLVRRGRVLRRISHLRRHGPTPSQRTSQGLEQ